MYRRDRKELTVNGEKVEIQTRIDYERSRTSPLEFTLQHARGRVPSLYKEEEVVHISVFHNSRLLGNIRKVPNGMFTDGVATRKTVEAVVEVMVNRLIK